MSLWRSAGPSQSLGILATWPNRTVRLSLSETTGYVLTRRNLRSQTWKKTRGKYSVNLNNPPTSAHARVSSDALSGKPDDRPKRVKIKMTKAGLTFSGKSAFLSYMDKCLFVFKKTPYSSVEQGYRHLYAQFGEEPAIAAKIFDTHEPLAIKKHCLSPPQE